MSTRRPRRGESYRVGGVRVRTYWRPAANPSPGKTDEGGYRLDEEQKTVWTTAKTGEALYAIVQDVVNARRRHG